MKKYVLLLFCLALLPAVGARAEEYPYAHFTLVTSLDQRYVKLIAANVQAFYSDISQQFFLTPGPGLRIYYSKTQADSQKLLDDGGYKVKVEYGYFAQQASAVYVHQFMNNGQPCPWSALFSEISRHIVSYNFSTCPPWFYEGLACFLGEQRTIVKGKLTPPVPNLWREQILRDKIERAQG